MDDPATEARRWWSQALDDRAFIGDMSKDAQYFGEACFLAQQAAEKAVKACLYAAGRPEVTGHAVREFVLDLAGLEPRFKEIVAQATRLDGVPGGTPFHKYSATELRSVREDMEAVFSAAEGFLQARGILKPSA
jgi:HEPN domain-containing protein